MEVNLSEPTASSLLNYKSCSLFSTLSSEPEQPPLLPLRVCLWIKKIIFSMMIKSKKLSSLYGKGILMNFPGHKLFSSLFSFLKIFYHIFVKKIQGSILFYTLRLYLSYSNSSQESKELKSKYFISLELFILSLNYMIHVNFHSKKYKI